MAFSLVRTIFLTLIFTFSPSTCVSSAASTPSSNFGAIGNKGFRVDLTHIDASKGFTRTELVQRAILRSKARTVSLASRVKFSPITVHPAGPAEGEYVLEFAIGTPPFYITGILDTGSDLIWTQCKGCIDCIPQPTPLFDPFTSSTFSAVPCSDQLCSAVSHTCSPHNCIYIYGYRDGTSSVGFLGNETFIFGSTRKVSVPHISFGCALFSGGSLNNASALFGFANGPLSLISQLGVTKFSYCYTEILVPNPKKSPLLFGSLARLTGPNVQTTPLIRSKFQPFYYISLKGITVGNTLLPIPPETFELKKNGSGGTIIDSGTPFLSLVPGAYGPFFEAFKSQVKLPYVNGTDVDVELCFATKTPQAVNVPKLVFHLEGADWEMPRENYMYYDTETRLYCVMVSLGEEPSILGNTNTQNMHVLYDLKNGKLSWVPTKCSKL